MTTAPEVWIPGSRAAHAPRNDAEKETCDVVVLRNGVNLIAKRPGRLDLYQWRAEERGRGTAARAAPWSSTARPS
jgi:hypothetical protein